MKPTEAWAALDTSQPDPQWMFTTSSRNATAWAKMDSVTVVPVLIVPRGAVREAWTAAEHGELRGGRTFDGREDATVLAEVIGGTVARVGIFELEAE